MESYPCEEVTHNEKANGFDGERVCLLLLLVSWFNCNLSFIALQKLSLKGTSCYFAFAGRTKCPGAVLIDCFSLYR